MVWTLAIHRRNRRWVAQYDGSENWVRGHFTPALIERFNVRVICDQRGPTLTAKTEGSTLFCRPGDWLLLSHWPKLNRWELYWNKNQIFVDDYDLANETMDVHDDGLLVEPLGWEKVK